MGAYHGLITLFLAHVLPQPIYMNDYDFYLIVLLSSFLLDNSEGVGM